MMTNEQKAAAILEAVETRVVWTAMFNALRASGSCAGARQLGQTADEGLAEYRKRFPAIVIPD